MRSGTGRASWASWSFEHPVVTWPPQIAFLQSFDELLLDHKIFKKSFVSRATQNLKNRSRGRPRPPFGLILDYFWHPFFN